MNRVNIASKSLLVIACLVLGVTGCASNNTIADNQSVEKKEFTASASVNTTTQESTKDILTQANAELLISLLEDYAPSELDDSVLASKEPVYIWDWFRKLQVWTDDLTRLANGKPKAEGAVKDVITSRLNKYFTPEASEKIFDSFFRAATDGSYETFERERFEKGLEAIDENLKVDIQKNDQDINVTFTGIEYDYFNPGAKQKYDVNVQFKLVKDGTKYLIDDIKHD